MQEKTQVSKTCTDWGSRCSDAHLHSPFKDYAHAFPLTLMSRVYFIVLPSVLQNMLTARLQLWVRVSFRRKTIMHRTWSWAEISNWGESFHHLSLFLMRHQMTWRVERKQLNLRNKQIDPKEKIIEMKVENTVLKWLISLKNSSTGEAEENKRRGVLRV